MRGEFAIGGIYVPTLLVICLLALLLTFVATQIANLVGLYRYVAYRALVDVCFFIFILGLLAVLLPAFGFNP